MIDHLILPLFGLYVRTRLLTDERRRHYSLRTETMSVISYGFDALARVSTGLVQASYEVSLEGANLFNLFVEACLHGSPRRGWSGALHSTHG